MSGYVWAKGDAVVQINHIRAVITRGECRHDWDEVVKARPELFSDQPTLVVRAVGQPPEVEQATAAPGEKRATRRAS
ncbi:MAG TPA: hypothetical protein VGK49_06760 [Ilumatobacteraceae bacterium]